MTTEPTRIPLPWSRSCLVCGEANPIGLRARSFLAGEEIELAFVPREEFTGWNGVIHGGLIATVLDEIMTWAAIVHSDRACFAAEFSVRLREALHPGVPVRARARCESERRGVHSTRAWLESTSGQLLATATGRYMAIPDGQVALMHNDLVTAPGCWPAGHIFGVGAAGGPAAQPRPTHPA